ncbi:MAG: hypothetical protein ACXWCZ_05820 [Flavisolibacter sp.]
MANEVMSVVDPFGNTIFLLEGICVENEESDAEIYDTAVNVIQKPAMVIEVEKENSFQHYYFRSIGWHNTMLISVLFSDGKWVSDKCIRNPSNEELSALLKMGKQIL